MSGAVVLVDVVERGRALVMLPNGQAFIGRMDGRYYADVSEWDGHENHRHPYPYREGLTSYRAAATWLARQLGHRGKLEIRIEKEY
jgi:hypothetical protein